MSEVPRFAVVGRVNKGKSSIIATLAEDDSVRIDPRPGTTTEVREFPVRVDARTLFVLVDTPGFEEAAAALAWLREGETTAAERPARVAALVRAFEGTDRFVEERKLLRPILGGAAVLYVVDGTKPYRPNYEAEMEILRWVGRPGMALINRIGEGDHAAEWRRALDQYFKIVLDFDAFSVSFESRLHLLQVFRELEPAWRPAIDEALAALLGQRRRRRHEAAAILAELLVDALTHVEEVDVRDEAELEAERDRLERRFHDALRKREAKARRSIEGLYAHREVRWKGRDLERPAFHQDLFAEEAWRLLGLSPGQLLAAGAAAGAAVGGAVDVMVGGASFLTGTVLGTAIGGGTALYGLGRRFARVRVVGAPGMADWVRNVRRYWEGGRRFRIGPHAQPNFPWVLLDRALLHYRSVLGRTHARRGEIELPEADGKGGVVATLERGERAELEGLFRKLRRHADDPPRALRDGLYERLLPLVARLDPLPDDATPRQP